MRHFLHIVNVFYLRGTIESRGRGIALIMQSCHEQCLLEPKIEIVPSFVNLTIWFKELLSAQDYKTLQVGTLPSARADIRVLPVAALCSRNCGDAREE